VKRVLKFNELVQSQQKAEEFIREMENSNMNDSNLTDTNFNKILKNLSNDLKFNIGLLTTFGTGIKFMIPIVQSLIVNKELNVELNDENLVLIAITTISIVYLQEKGNKTGNTTIPCPNCSKSKENCEIFDGRGWVKSKVTREDTKTLLEELKLRGVGNGIIKKLVKCFESIGKLFQIIFKNTQYVISGFLDMLGYTALLLPTMNAINALISRYEFNLDTLPGNLMSVGVGFSSFALKNSMDFLINKIKKSNIKINPQIKKTSKSTETEINDGESKSDEGDLVLN